MFKTTVLEIWRNEQQKRKLMTLCSGLDKQLGGGMELGKISEFCGGPGTGKTQMCLQLCITAQFPDDCGGLGGKTIFIDTNQDFSPQRLKEIAEAISNRFQNIYNNKASQNVFNWETLLNNVQYNYCSDISQLMAQIILLRSSLNDNSNIKLIAIDSFSFLIRLIDDDVSERTRLSFEILSELQKLAIEFQIAIVLTNELTTHLSGREWTIKPALGNIHLHKINQRIILTKSPDSDQRTAYVAKSVESPKVEIPIKIRRNGVRSWQ